MITDRYLRQYISIMLILLVSPAGAQMPDSAWIAARYAKQEVMVPMRDGVKLFTTIYSPKDKSEKHPVLMMRTPYSVAPYGKDRFSSRLYTTHWINYVNENYIIVMQDVRGAFMSEGEFVDIRPFIEKKTGKQTDEATDAYDAIEWLVKNTEGNNGKVGIFGISYPGFYATMAAASSHPALKAASPQAPVTEWFLGDDFHHNGAFALMDGFGFYSSFGRPRPVPVTTRAGKPFVYSEKDLYFFHLKQGALKNYKKLMGDSIKFWTDLMSHPDYDEWWKSRDARRAVKNLKPAMLVVGGNFDAEDCYGAWNLYKAIEKQSPGISNQLVMGPWFHGGWHRSEGSYLGNVRFGGKTSTYYQEQLEVPFFNYHLKGKGDLKKLAEATIFFSGENNWKQFNSWPPQNTNYVPLYLGENNTLTFEKPSAQSSFSQYSSNPDKPVPYADGVQLSRTREYMSDDQRFAARRPDVLVFETAALSEDLTLAGPLKAELKVMLSCTDADFVVKLIDVFPKDFTYDSTYCCKGAKNEAVMGGYQMLVRGEIMRGRYRKNFSTPEAFSPATPETVAFELPDVSHTFKKGHKIMVQVQSSWFPLFDMNPQKFTNIYTCNDDEFTPCDIKILHQRGEASNIILPVLKNP
jgi:uncharacterized protein